MQEVKEWALAIAGIVVFASLLEMLVPTGALKRYVQLAMGLLVLLTLLTPVLGVLQRTHDLAWEAGAAWAPGALSLDAVLSRADALRSGNVRRQTELYRQSLEAAAAIQAQRALGGRPAAASVELGPPPADGGAPPIRRVTLTPGQAPPGQAAAAGSGATGLVAPVAPVGVSLGQEAAEDAGAAAGGETAGRRGAAPASSGATPALTAAEVRAVRQAVAAELGLDPATVEIRGDIARE
ncbi:MAG: stage III sporulation protein AF [Bacillota bacterium]